MIRRTLPALSFSFFAFAVFAVPLLAFAQADDGFVPLTNLPGLSQTISSDTLPDLLNQIYRLCIGAAAVIAVLQIMRAGAYFMFNKGSVAHNEKAKSLIQNSVLGLLLVLSPAIVFGIINRDILNLKLDFTELQPKEVTNPPDTQESGALGSDRASSESGTVLQTGVFRLKRGMEVFVDQCSIIKGGIGATKGCTQKCTVGTPNCDSEGCLEYTGFCSVPEKDILMSKANAQNEYAPHSTSKSRYDAFVAACSTDKGTLTLKNAGGASQQVAAPCPAGAAGSPETCVKIDLYCRP